ncbi:hypothetical protein PVAND_000001 [Polypedilum vanderplanki]|uniref:Uncharacterized protein n=1 Tax=Polypedilum vanderplanki TaxID=319348 RepID=A0A9J6BIH7_POLVA|nr:hypothetical protein PVAND_000001 [Polypedilum vanderplanki]
MVHDNLTKICAQHETDCVVTATNAFFTINRLKEEYQCDCKPSCIDYQYNIELSEAEYEFEKVFNAYNTSYDDEFSDTLMSRLRIYFKNEYFTQSTINNNKLVEIVLKSSKYGGIIAFYLGASIITIVEIFYFLVNKIFQ